MIKILKWRFVKAFLFLAGTSLYAALTINGEVNWALVPLCFVFWLYVREIFCARSYKITRIGGGK